MEIPTLLRKAEHVALTRVSLSGSVLDLGGDKNSGYAHLLGEELHITTVNTDERASPDIFHDLEQSLPLADASYDHVLLINVLEHIYNYRQLLSEAARTVRSGGTVTIIVPFLFPLHPSPNDFWRFSAETLRRECGVIGLTVEELLPLGSGVFAARYVMIDRLMPTPLRLIGAYTLAPLSHLLDVVFARLASLLGKKYIYSDYALGYFVCARKSL
mgnify:CR=1 FL=1